MPHPNRTERGVHWRIELFKLCWATATGALLLLFTVKEGWLMIFAVCVAVAMSAIALSLGYTVIQTLRKLPDD